MGFLLVLLCGLAVAEEVPDPVAAFLLPPPTQEGSESILLWSTHYVLHLADEVAAADGLALRGIDDRPFPPDAPVNLTVKDWCYAALEGSAQIKRLDGELLTVNYAGTGDLVVDCGPPLGNARWRTQGTVRFGQANGPYGDGVAGYRLVPYRTLATDPAVIPTGSVVYIPQARGVAFELDGQQRIHDGYFFAADVGGAIKGLHIDTFTGTEMSPPFPHIGNQPDSRFVAFVLENTGPIEQGLSAAHR
ncbi:MAG: 3D domain-containing protein [Myxococcota bacterium]